MNDGMRFITATPTNEENVLAGVDHMPVDALHTTAFDSLRLFIERGGLLANDPDTVAANRCCLVCVGACVTRLLDLHDGDVDLEDTHDAEQDDDPAEDPDVDEDSDPAEVDNEDRCAAHDDHLHHVCHSDGGAGDPEDAEHELTGFCNPGLSINGPTVEQQLRNHRSGGAS